MYEPVNTSFGLWWDNVLSSIGGTVKGGINTVEQSAKAEASGTIWRVLAIGTVMTVSMFVLRDFLKRR